MSDPPPPASTHTFDCPQCDGTFEIDAECLGKTIPCPHCGRGVQLPGRSLNAPSAEPPRKRTAQERAARRRKVNLTLAVAGALLLISLFLFLAQTS